MNFFRVSEQLFQRALGIEMAGEKYFPLSHFAAFLMLLSNDIVLPPFKQILLIPQTHNTA